MPGGSRGIGKALALRFAEAGAKVVINGRDQASLDDVVSRISNEQIWIEGIVSDIRGLKAIKGSVRLCVQRHFPIDVLINFAVNNKRKSAIEVTDDDYDKIFDTNLKGAFQVSVEV